MKKMMVAILLFMPFMAQAQRGRTPMPRPDNHVVVVPQHRPVFRPGPGWVAPTILGSVIGSMLSSRQVYCVRYYGHYPCDYPYYEPEVVYVPGPAPRRTVVIVGAPQAVDTVYVRDSTMKDTIKIVKH